MAEADLKNFTIHGRARNLPDPQKSWLWQVTFFNLHGVVPMLMSGYDGNAQVVEEDLRVRCRSLSLPPRDHEEITSQFMTTKQHFWGKPQVDGTVQMTFEETNDQKIRQIFHTWQQRMVNVNPSGVPYPLFGGAGQSNVVRAKDLKLDVIAEMFNYNGDKLPQETIWFGMYPKTVGDVSLNYAESSTLQFNVTFQYDYHLQGHDVSGTPIYW